MKQHSNVISETRVSIKKIKTFPLSLVSWAFYDWANSSFAAVIQTFIFAAYFVNSVAINENIGSAAWGTVTGLSALVVALLSPILGAIADQCGARKLWLAAFTILCVIPTALLWFIKPDPEYTWMALWCVGIGAIGAEGAYIFYNAMLPELAPDSQLGRWSGWGWGMGYAGGMAALVLCLFAFINGGDSWFLLDTNSAEPVRATFILTAIWYSLFSIPIFLFTPRSPSNHKNLYQASIDGMHQLWTTLRQIRRYKTIVHFLVAKIFYVDGLATLFAFGGIYAATVFGMEQSEVLLFGIGMNLVAGFGAIALASLDDKIGSKKVILYSLVGMIIPGFLSLFVIEKWQFWVLGLSICLFVGPVQSSSRALMARISPIAMRRQMFGFYMLSGKATAFFGPLLYGWITYMTGSLRWGMSTIILLFVIGGIIMFTLPEKLEQKD